MIEINGLYKSFAEHEVLRDLDLVIEQGESLVIIGRSGCGKSVLLKHIIGLMRPDRGIIKVNGLDVSRARGRELNSMRKDFGMLFQGAALFDSMTVVENVGFQLLEYTDMSEKEISLRVAECLEMVGLRGVENIKPAELSGGMKKRVGLARAICMWPKIILFDEPTTGLDPIMGDVINDLIRELHERLKISSVTVTHDMKSAYKIADRIAMLYDKKIIAAGTPSDIKNSDNGVVRQFITGRAKGPITIREE